MIWVTFLILPVAAEGQCGVILLQNPSGAGLLCTLPDWTPPVISFPPGFLKAVPPARGTSSPRLLAWLTSTQV